jgi:phosphate-selective porin OprO/OprP
MKWFVKFSLLVVLATSLAAVACAGTTPLVASSEDGVLVFKSDDGQFKWWFDARAYIDAAMYLDDGPLYDPASGDYGDYEDLQDSLAGGTFIRRARLALKAELWGDWYSEVDMDFAEETTALKDAYISYRGIFGGNGRVRVGNFRQPFGLEEVTTSRNLTFMERSLGTDPFVVGRRMGLEVTRWSPDFRASASVFGADVEDFAKEANETFSYAARLNYTPINDDDSTLMLGAAGTLRTPDFGSEEAKFDTRPETNISDTKFTYVKVKDVDSWTVFGGEMAYINQRLRLQGEYMMTDVSRLDGDPSVSYSGGYVFASYFLTDDKHEWDSRDAEISRFRPNNKSGAWELAARYSFLDLDDPEKMGGEATAMTLGLNYYANANVRIYLNYGHVDNGDNAIGKDEQFMPDYDFDYVQVRFLTAF